MDSLHVNSRDAKRLRAASAREDKLSRLMDAAARANQVYGIIAASEHEFCTLTIHSGESGLVQSSTGGLCGCADRRGSATTYSQVG